MLLRQGNKSLCNFVGEIIQNVDVSLEDADERSDGIGQLFCTNNILNSAIHKANNILNSAIHKAKIFIFKLTWSKIHNAQK